MVFQCCTDSASCAALPEGRQPFCSFLPEVLRVFVKAENSVNQIGIAEAEQMLAIERRRGVIGFVFADHRYPVDQWMETADRFT